MPARVNFSDRGVDLNNVDGEGFELNGNTSDFNEAEDGPGISSGRTVSRPAGGVSQRA